MPDRRLDRDSPKELVCCLCGVVIANGRGNNARPVGPGRCCNDCNQNIVNPHRLNPPTVTPEEFALRVGVVEHTLDNLAEMYAELVWFFGERESGEEPVGEYADEIREKYPDVIARMSEDPARWLPRAEGMLAAFKLAHGLVAGGEEEDLAKDRFPEFEP